MLAFHQRPCCYNMILYSTTKGEACCEYRRIISQFGDPPSI